MNEQAWFNFYATFVVSIGAQCLLAWELGYRGIERILREGPGSWIVGALILFGVQGLWQRVSGLESPFESVRDAWPVLIAIVVFFVGRIRRPESQE
jgi:hypothetical protein